MSRLDKDRQKELEPQRMDVAVYAIIDMGYEVNVVDDHEVNFMFEGHTVKLFPYSGWHTGKSIKDGRGLDKLLKQLKIMKTVSQWISTFPEPYKSQSLKNANETNLPKKVENASAALYLAFAWKKSPEGYQYWNEFKQTLTKR